MAWTIKKIIILLLMLVLPAHAKDIPLAWDHAWTKLNI